VRSGVCIDGLAKGLHKTLVEGLAKHNFLCIDHDGLQAVGEPRPVGLEHMHIERRNPGAGRGAHNPNNTPRLSTISPGNRDDRERESVLMLADTRKKKKKKKIQGKKKQMKHHPLNEISTLSDGSTLSETSWRCAMSTHDARAAMIHDRVTMVLHPCSSKMSIVAGGRCPCAAGPRGTPLPFSTWSSSSA
jgi:hypothetical protein